ncbi:MAG: hypothetical protein B7X98_01945, partial [Methylophilaceae bacterium 17-43-7]
AFQPAVIGTIRQSDGTSFKPKPMLPKSFNDMKNSARPYQAKRAQTKTSPQPFTAKKVVESAKPQRHASKKSSKPN